MTLSAQRRGQSIGCYAKQDKLTPTNTIHTFTTGHNTTTTTTHNKASHSHRVTPKPSKTEKSKQYNIYSTHTTSGYSTVQHSTLHCTALPPSPKPHPTNLTPIINHHDIDT